MPGWCNRLITRAAWSGGKPRGLLAPQYRLNYPPLPNPAAGVEINRGEALIVGSAFGRVAAVAWVPLKPVPLELLFYSF